MSAFVLRGVNCSAARPPNASLACSTLVERMSMPVNPATSYFLGSLRKSRLIASNALMNSAGCSLAPMTLTQL